jgi:DNA topoisomerase-1
MKGLTAKVFRTYNASITFQQQLDESTPTNASVQEKLNAYNHANRMVAILCNHQRSVPKTHEQSMDKMRDKVSHLSDWIVGAFMEITSSVLSSFGVLNMIA